MRNRRKAPLRGRLHPALPVEGATRAPIIDVVKKIQRGDKMETITIVTQ